MKNTRVGCAKENAIELALEMGHVCRLKEHIKKGYVKKSQFEATHDWEFFIRDKASTQMIFEYLNLDSGIFTLCLRKAFEGLNEFAHIA